MTAPKPGIVRFIPRWNEHGVGPVVGLVTFPLPDDAQAGDLIEVVLGPNGTATWSVKAHDALGKEGDSPWPNAQTYDGLFSGGHVTSACMPEEANGDRVPHRWVRLPRVEARIDALWPLLDREPFDPEVVGDEIQALAQLVGDYDPHLGRARALADFLRD